MNRTPIEWSAVTGRYPLVITADWKRVRSLETVIGKWKYSVTEATMSSTGATAYRFEATENGQQPCTSPMVTGGPIKELLGLIERQAAQRTQTTNSNEQNVSGWKKAAQATFALLE